MDSKIKKHDIMTFIFPDMQDHSDPEDSSNHDFSLDDIHKQELTESKENPLINTLKINKFFSSIENDLAKQKSTESIKLLNIIRISYLDNGIQGIQHALADIRNKILEEIQK